MSRKVRPLTLRMTNELQIILGAMEMGDYMASLTACGRAQAIAVQLRTELLQVIEEEHRDDIKRHRAELDAIKKLMPYATRRSSPP